MWCHCLGDAGRHSDGGIWGNSLLRQALEDGDLNIPEDLPLPGLAQESDFITTLYYSLLKYISGTTGPVLPFTFVGDEAFPLRRYMLRPYAGRHLDQRKAVFNYRLSRARRIVENAFGILAARCAHLYVLIFTYSNLLFHVLVFLTRWRIFRRPIIADPDNVVTFTKATIALHNFLRTEENALYCPASFVDGEDGSGNVIPGTWRDSEEPTGLVRAGTIASNR